MKNTVPKFVRLLLAYVADQKRQAQAMAMLTAKVNGYGQNRGQDRAGRRKP